MTSPAARACSASVTAKSNASALASNSGQKSTGGARFGDRITSARAGPFTRTTVPQPGGRSSSREATTTRRRRFSGSSRRGCAVVPDRGAVWVCSRILSRPDVGAACGSWATQFQSGDCGSVSHETASSVGGTAKQSCTRTARARASASGIGPTIPSPCVTSTTIGAPVTVAAHSRKSRCSFGVLAPRSRMPLGAGPVPSATSAASVWRQRAAAALPRTIVRADGVCCQASSRQRE